MSDHIEEQEMEAEALSAIFDTAFTIRSSTQPFIWSIKLVPVDCGDDEDESEVTNHVMVNLVATIPPTYPESALPQLDIEVIKGLSPDNKNEILEIANNEAQANEGMAAIFAVCEAVREWLADNNVKGLDDASMHAQMMRKAKEAERREVREEHVLCKLILLLLCFALLEMYDCIVMQVCILVYIHRICLYYCHMAMLFRKLANIKRKRPGQDPIVGIRQAILTPTRCQLMTL